MTQADIIRLIAVARELARNGQPTPGTQTALLESLANAKP